VDGGDRLRARRFGCVTPRRQLREALTAEAVGASSRTRTRTGEHRRSVTDQPRCVLKQNPRLHAKTHARLRGASVCEGDAGHMASLRGGGGARVRMRGVPAGPYARWCGRSMRRACSRTKRSSEWVALPSLLKQLGGDAAPAAPVSRAPDRTYPRRGRSGRPARTARRRPHPCRPPRCPMPAPLRVSSDATRSA
jgi:hypothetical protein